MISNSQHNHPLDGDLLAHAEGLVGPYATFDRELAEHLRTCASCRVKVEDIRASLAFVDSVDTLEPSLELSNSIEMGSKKLRREQQTRQALHAILSGGKRVAMAAGVVLMAGIFLNTGIRNGAIPAADQVTIQPATQFKADVFSLDALKALTVEEEILFSAVMSEDRLPQSAWERSQIRAVRAYDDDISEAMEAFASNPALVRAGHLIYKNRERKSQTLKDVYARRN